MDIDKLGTYSMEFDCSNCGHSWTACIPKGTPAGFNRLCPNCGCTEGKANKTDRYGWRPKKDDYWMKGNPLRENMDLCGRADKTHLVCPKTCRTCYGATS